MKKKKDYEAPELEIIPLETREMLIEGSGIEVGDEGEPD